MITKKMLCTVLFVSAVFLVNIPGICLAVSADNTGINKRDQWQDQQGQVQQGQDQQWQDQLGQDQDGEDQRARDQWRDQGQDQQPTERTEDQQRPQEDLDIESDR